MGRRMFTEPGPASHTTMRLFTAGPGSLRCLPAGEAGRQRRVLPELTNVGGNRRPSHRS